MSESTSEARRLIVFGVLTTIAAVLLVLVLYQVRSTLLLVYVSALFAMGISPLVRVVERQRVVDIGRRLPRWVAILLIYGVIVGALFSIAALVIPPLVDQAEELSRTLPSKIDEAQAALVRIGVLRRPITLGEAVQQAPVSGGAAAFTTIFGAVRNIVGGLFGLVMLIILAFYMLVESRLIFAFFVSLFAVRHRPRVAVISKTVVKKVSAWLGGQLLLALIIGTTSAVGLGLMGVPYFYVLALISAIGEMIPMVGPILAAIPAVLVAVTVSPGLAIGVVVFFTVQQQLENHILVPKVMGRQVGLSAVAVIVSLAVGGELLGVVGAILSVPTAAIIQVLVQELVTREP